MKILVSGAGGFLGQHLVQLLLKRGHTVRAIFRSPPAVYPSWIDNVEPIYADLLRDRLEDLFNGIDAVIHLAGVTRATLNSTPCLSVAATERFLEAMAGSKANRLIHISSLSIYDWSRATEVLDETTPVLSDLDGMGEYAISKVRQEALVLKYAQTNTWDVTVLRPGFIWGPGRAEVAGMGRRWRRLYVLFGPFTELPLCHVDNCSDFIATVVETRAIAYGTFNVIDDCSIKVWRYVFEYMARTKQFGLVLPIPYFFGLQVARLASFATQRILKRTQLPSLLIPRRFEAQFRPVKFSRQRARTQLSWRSPLDFETCLEITYRRTSLTQ